MSTFKYHIATVSNRTPHEYYYLQKEFYKSLAGYEVTTIDYSGEHFWTGLATKPKWLYRAIKENRFDGTHLIFCDSWDLVFGANPDEVMKVYDTFASPVVISAEKNCFPGTYKKEFDELDIPAPYSYVNSGVIIGEIEAILACLESMDLPNVPGDHFDAVKQQQVNPEDQTLWQQTFLKQPVKITIDYNQAISQALHEHSVDDFDFAEQKIRNKITGCHPRMWHFNGSAKTNNDLKLAILNHFKLI